MGTLPPGWEEHGQAEAESVLSKSLMKHFGCGFVHRRVSTVVQNAQEMPKRMGVLMSLEC